MDKISKEKIKQLKAQGKYDEIFREYGPKAYKRYVPYKYRSEDLKKLKHEGKYEDIYNKYGKSEYNKLLVKAMYNEIKDAKGFGAAIVWRAKEAIASTAKRAGILSLAAFLEFSTIMSISTESLATENAEKYKQDIQNYNEKIAEYAQKVNKWDFSDMQIFMKVMDDMWESIKGYGEAEKNIAGFLELDLATSEGIGVCRHMASDIAKKLNQINSKYNARTITVTMGEDGTYKCADIKRNVIETNETVVDSNDSQNNNEKSKIIENIFGNHMVTLVDVKEDNLTIVLDPTNPGLGIYINGQIIMLNSIGENGLEFKAKEYSSAILAHGGIDGILDVTSDYIKSFQKPNLSFEEIEKKYGIDAQNKALVEVRARMIIEEQSFDEKYKVSPSELGELQTTSRNDSEISYDLEI